MEEELEGNHQDDHELLHHHHHHHQELEPWPSTTMDQLDDLFPQEASAAGPEEKSPSNLGLGMLMFYILVIVGLTNIPPFTLVYSLVQMLVYLRALQVPWCSADDVALSAEAVLVRGEWWRLLLSTLEHSSDWDLFYTVGSFILHGLQLEFSLGTPRFLYLVLGIFTPLTGLLHILMALLLSQLGTFSFHASTTVGFSGVMFAVKALALQRYPFSSNVPSQYAIWLELLLLQLIMRDPSLLSHLAGIFVGSAYSSGPLRYPVDWLWKMLEYLAPTAEADDADPPRRREHDFNAQGDNDFSEDDDD